jgi:hypothetical protein
MTRYAKDTSVPVERSKAELEKTLIRYGASGFYSMWEGTQAVIGFKILDANCIEQEMPPRLVKIEIPLPAKDDDAFMYTETGRERSDAQAFKAWEQACRSRWRAVNLIVKAKLEAIECGISTIDREFLADIVMPNGKTVGQFLGPQIGDMYLNKRMPKMLPGVSK